MMNIIVYAAKYKESIGGLQRASQDMVCALRKLGYVVTIFTTEKFEFCDQRIRYTPAFFISIISKLIKCDVFIVRGGVALRAIFPAMILMKKIIIFHEMDVNFAEEKFGFIKKYITKKVFFNVFVSKSLSESFNYKYLPRSQVRVLKNDYKKLDAGMYDKIPKIKNRKYDFCYVGRMTREKGFDDFIAGIVQLASKEDREIYILLIGDGDRLTHGISQLKSYRNIIYELKYTTSQEDIYASLINVKCVVVPSREHNEGMGLVAYESIECGCMVIVSDQNALAEATLGLGLQYERYNLIKLSLLINNIFNLSEIETDRMESKVYACRLQNLRCGSYVDEIQRILLS